MIFTIHFGGKIPLFLGWHPYRYKIRSTEESTSQPVDRHLLNHLLILAPSCLSENELKWCFMMFPRKSCYLIYIIIYKHIRMYIMHLHMQMIWFIIWYDMIWYDMIWYDMIWYDMIWYDMIWYDTRWCEMIWYYIRYTLYPRYRHVFISVSLLKKVDGSSPRPTKRPDWIISCCVSLFEMRWKSCSFCGFFVDPSSKNITSFQSPVVETTVNHLASLHVQASATQVLASCKFFAQISRFQKKSPLFAPWKINMEPQNRGFFEMIFLFNCVLF